MKKRIELTMKEIKRPNVLTLVENNNLTRPSRSLIPAQPYTTHQIFDKLCAMLAAYTVGRYSTVGETPPGFPANVPAFPERAFKPTSTTRHPSE